MNAQILLVFSIGEKGQGRLAADILDGTPDKFSGELCLQQNMNFTQAAALFGGDFVYPQDLEDHGFQTGENVGGKASLWYHVSEGSFGIVVEFTQNWKEHYGDGKFVINNIRGSVEYTGKVSEEYHIGLKGSFSLGNYMADMTLAFGVGEANVPTLLELTFKNDISLPHLIASVSNSESYEALSVPEGFIKPEQAFEIKAKLNLTDQTFLLIGQYVSKSGFHASAVVHFSKQEQEYIWWVGVQMTHFTLSDISFALEGADRFLGLENVTAAVILSCAKQEVQAVEGAEFIGDVGTVRPGLTFRIDVALNNEFLKEVLKIDGTCSISGYIPADKEEAITLSGHGNSILFLKFLTLREIEIRLVKNLGEKSFFFSLSGNIQMTYPDLKIPKIKAQVTLEESEKKKTVMLKGEVGEPVDEPLGIPSTTLNQLIFYAISEKTEYESTIEESEQVYFEGSADIGNLNVVAQIHFVRERSDAQMSPALVNLTIGADQKLSISSLVAKYVRIGWTDFLDIELYNGMIWYCSEDVILNGVKYRNGFHAQVDTKIFFLPELTLSIDIIDIDRGKKLEAGARFKKAVELAFIKFYTEEGAEEYGPKMSISVAEGISDFVFTTNISIFSYEAGIIQISARKKWLEGMFTFPDNLPLAGKVTFIVDDKGVSLGECPISNLKLTDYKLPKMQVGGGLCNKIQILQGPKFKAVPKVKSKGVQLDDIGFEAKFDFIIQIKSETSFSDSGGDNLVKLNFTDMTITAKKSQYTKFSFDTLLELIGDNIAGLIQNASEQIISGQIFKEVLSKESLENIAKFLTTSGISWVASEVVNYLVCKGLKKLLAKMFVSALTGLSPSVWIGLGISLVLGGIIIVVLSSDGALRIVEKAPGENEEEPDKNPEKPNAPVVSFRDEELIISWNACEKAKGYGPIVSRVLPEHEEGTETINLILGTCTDTEYKVKGSDEEDLMYASYGFEYLIRIYAWSDEGASMGDESPIYLLRRPDGFKLRYRCEQQSLTVSWNAIDMAQQYEVERVWYEKGEEKKETLTYEWNIREVVYENIEPGQSVKLTVRGIAENVIGPAAGPEILYLYDLQVPSNIQGYDTDDGIALEWERVPYADRYEISCWDDAGGQINVPVSFELQTLIGAEYLQEDVCYTIHIRPMTEEIEGRLSKEVKVLWKLLPVPEILELICGEDGLMVFVLLADNVQTRQLVYPDGRVVVLDEQQVSCEWDIGENARVRIVDRARRGKWSDEISVKPLRSPQNLRLSIKEEMLCVEWNETGEDSAYGIEILADNFQQVVEPIDTTSWQIPVSELPEKEIARICLYAIDRSDQRRRSNAVESSLDFTIHL